MIDYMARNVLRSARAGKLDPQHLLQVASDARKDDGGREEGEFDLAECAVEDEGLLGSSCLGEVGHPVREAVAGVVVGARDVAVVAPLLIPDIDDGDAGVADHGHKLRRRHVGHAPPSHGPAAGAGREPPAGKDAEGLLAMFSFSFFFARKKVFLFC